MRICTLMLRLCVSVHMSTTEMTLYTMTYGQTDTLTKTLTQCQLLAIRLSQ